jgi:hypothetical protein
MTGILDGMAIFGDHFHWFRPGPVNLSCVKELKVAFLLVSSTFPGPPLIASSFAPRGCEGLAMAGG